MAVKQVNVDSRESLQFSTTTYLAKGFVVANSTSNARKGGGHCEARPLYEVIYLAQKKILTGLPVLGK